MPLPHYFSSALWVRKRTAMLNRTPLPVVVVHPDFYYYLLRASDDGSFTPTQWGAVECMGMRLRSDYAVPFGEIWYE